jgi:hypothetical protein
LAAIAGPRITPFFLKYSIASGVVGKLAPKYDEKCYIF